MAVRLPMLVLGAGGLLFTAGCHVLGGCSKPDGYAGAQEIPRLKMPAGLDGPDTAKALQIPALTEPAAGTVPEGSCLEDPPPMREPGSNSLPTGEVQATEPKRERRSTTPVGPGR
jgi:uncharacterized lipoprotein